MHPTISPPSLMAFLSLITFLFLSSLFHSTTCLISSPQVYIIYMGNYQMDKLQPKDMVVAHHNMLYSLLDSTEDVENSLIYSYTFALNGFSALLSPEHADALADEPGVISVFPSRMYTLDTTHSWEFLGLENSQGISHASLWNKTNYGEDSIIGMIDSGVWPESASFNDEGMGAIPSRWRGYCEAGTNFTELNCNRKLIGARYFVRGHMARRNISAAPGNILSPRDSEGHGTHTASTAAGRIVAGVDYLGYAHGNAKGGAPLSRLAIYKACWLGVGCEASDVLAAFDAGIYDGVDVFSTSFGYGPPDLDYFEDVVALGSFHAIQRGRMVVSSAGNYGPSPSTLHNVAPWILTVAASSIDREFGFVLTLGNQKQFQAESLSHFWLDSQKFYPIASGKHVRRRNSTSTSSKQCIPGSLDPEKTKGKIIVCLNLHSSSILTQGSTVKEAGGVGMIVSKSPRFGDYTFESYPLPAVVVAAMDAASIFEYINSTISPVASMTGPTSFLGQKPAPVMAAFSSQGPNPVTPDILKPDITAPGQHILAAYSEYPSAQRAIYASKMNKPTIVKYALLTGTSMSCPHVAGIAALLKALHPRWSAAAIKSAIMTTATQIDNTGEPIQISVDGIRTSSTPFGYGAGHINANEAAEPGLVYDTTPEDYALFFCGQKYNETVLQIMLGASNVSCPKTPLRATDLNYPSVTVSNLLGTLKVRRRVTNVGGKGIYKVLIHPPPGILVTVRPSELEFSDFIETKEFELELKAEWDVEVGKYVFGSFSWSDGKHFVRSPIVVKAHKPKI